MKQQADQEFSAMRRVVEILNALPTDARGRVLTYATERVRSDASKAPETQPGLPLMVAVAASPTDLKK